MEKSQDRLDIVAKIEEYERLGYFDRDVENDPPTRPLRPGEVDFTGRKLTTRIGSDIANIVARNNFNKQIKRGNLVIKEVRGIENYLSVSKSGAVITCNHFNAFDNYAVYKAIEPYLPGKRLYKIIREGNFTTFPGLYGYFFRHCNTLPIPSNHRILREMMQGVDTLLRRGEKILIYPEQAMWWNYRKPRPLKPGAFQFAASAGVPVVPFFISMEDTDKYGADGFPIQAYTVHILKPILPDTGKTVRENVHMMSDANFAAWKKVYEDTYGIPLEYTTEEKDKCSTLSS